MRTSIMVPYAVYTIRVHMRTCKYGIGTVIRGTVHCIYTTTTCTLDYACSNEATT